MKIQWLIRVLGAFAALPAGLASASPVFYQVDALGGDRWEYHYTLDNQTSELIDGLTVFFELDLFANLSVTGNANAGTFDTWNGEASQPDPALPDDGFGDWLALGAPLAPGGSLDGFSIAFDYLGAGSPGSQFFEVYRLEFGAFDFPDLVVIADGFTTPLRVEPPVSVPSPSSLPLLLTGLALLVLRQRPGAGRRLMRRRYRAPAAFPGLLVALLALPIDEVRAAVEAMSPISSISPGDRTLVNRERKGRFFFDYTYRLSFSYSGDPLTGVVATVTSQSRNTRIVDGEIVIGALTAGTVTPADTFTIRHNRRVPFNPDDLVWRFVADAPPPVGDNAPEIVSAPIVSGTAGTSYTYPVIAQDADAGDVLTYRLALAPQGMSIDPSSGVIRWTPPAAVAADVDVRVADTTGREDRQIYLLRVAERDGDQPPVLDPIPDWTLRTGESFQTTVTGRDPEGSALTYRVEQGPPGLAISPASGVLRFTARAATGVSPATVSASDPGGLQASQTFSITVTQLEANAPPVIDPIGDQQVSIGQSLRLRFSASDPDEGDILDFDLLDVPPGAQFDANDPSLAWTPTAGDAGLRRLTLRVTDSAGVAVSQTFGIEVLTPARPPLAIDDAYTVGIRDTLQVTAPGVLANDTDPNGDVLFSQDVRQPDLGTLQAFGDDGGFSYLPPPIPPIQIGLVEKCRTANRVSKGTISVADVDQDGVVELVGLVAGGRNRLFTSVFVVDGRDCSTESANTVPEFVGAASSSNTDTLVNLDDDPELEVVGQYLRFNAGGIRDERLYALNLDGTPLAAWPSSGLSEANSFTTALNSGNLLASPVAADLDGDGAPELITGLTNVSQNTTVQNTTRAAVVAYDGRTGSVLWEFVGGITYSIGRAAVPTIVDLDLDGDMEIIWSEHVLDHTGALLFDLPVAQTIRNGGNDFLTVAVANFDTDAYPEIIGYDASNITLYAHDGSIQWTRARDSGGFGFPWTDITVAELDGDRFPEFVMMLENEGGSDLALYAFDDDGTQLWEHASLGFVVKGFNQTRSSSPVAFDFDRDGIDELIQFKAASVDDVHPAGLYIIDGETGNIITFKPGNAQDNNDEALTVADVDGDGSAEILTNFSTEFGADSVQIWDNLPGEPFPPGPVIRSGSSSQPTWVNDDGSLPARIEPHWLIPGLNKVNAAVVVPDPATDQVDSFEYVASDGGLESDAATVRITLAAANAPRIVSSPPDAGSPGFLFAYAALATDADVGDSLSFELLEAPEGMLIDQFGVLSWVPTGEQAGPHQVELLVTDGQGNADRQSFTIDIRPPVAVPALIGLSRPEALAALESASLGAGNVAETFSLTAPEGTVAFQGIEPGSQVAAGSRIDFRLSLGPQPIFAPTLANLPRAAAELRLTDLTLSVGNVSFANSDTVPRGSVIGQSVPAASEVLPGTAVDFVVSGGPALDFQVSANLVPSGAGASFRIATFNPSGEPTALPGDLSIAVIPDAEASGDPVAADETGLSTGASTRGLFTVRVESASLAALVEEDILVDPGFAVDALQGAYGTLSEQLADVGQTVAELAAALRENNLADIAAAGSRLSDLRDAIDLDELQLTPAVDPGDGFLPATVPGFPNSTDEAFNRQLKWMLASVRESAEFLDRLQPGAARDDDIRAAFLNSRLQARAASFNNQNFSTRGLVAEAGGLYELLSLRLPQLILGDLNVLVGELESSGLLVNQLGPEAFYDGIAPLPGMESELAWRESPAFFSLAGVVSASGIRNRIIKRLYLKIVFKVVKLSQNLVAEGLLREFTDAVAIPGIVTGASQSFHVFESGHSIVEAFSAADLPDGHVIQVIGPTLISELASAIAGVRGVRFDSRNAMKRSVKQVKTAAGNAQAVLRQQYQQLTPDQLIRGCVFSSAVGCQQLGITDGLPIVHRDGGFPAPVLLIVHDVVGGNVTVGSFFFYPN